MIIERDRVYWRCCSTEELIEAAKYSDHELCIALGERLEETNRLLEKEYGDD